MTVEMRELYSSPNGDRWYLARDVDLGQVFIRHEPNLLPAERRRISKSVRSLIEAHKARNIESCYG
jgi:hypothetical protein